MEDVVSTPWPAPDDWTATDFWNATTEAVAEVLNQTVVNGTAPATVARANPPWVRALITMVYLIGNRHLIHSVIQI